MDYKIFKSIFIVIMSSKLCLFLCLFLGSALPALSGKCPEKDKLPSSCKCKDKFLKGDMEVDLTCKESNLVELRDALRLMDKNARLEVHLERIIMDPLPSDIFSGLNVVILEITHCDLYGLSHEGELPFSGLEDKLEVLAITASFFAKNGFFKLHLSHFNRLRELDVSYNSIPNLSDDWFADAPVTITHLMLSHDSIFKMGDHAFANLMNLEHLTLESNNYGPIKRSMFPQSADKLEFLNLRHNHFVTLPDDIFSGMTALKKLYISSNNIQYLSEKAFKPIWSQLVILDVGDNQIQCDSSLDWTFRVNSDVDIFGTCDGPEDRKGREVSDFIKKRGH